MYVSDIVCLVKPFIFFCIYVILNQIVRDTTKFVIFCRYIDMNAVNSAIYNVTIDKRKGFLHVWTAIWKILE